MEFLNQEDSLIGNAVWMQSVQLELAFFAGSLEDRAIVTIYATMYSRRMGLAGKAWSSSIE